MSATEDLTRLDAAAATTIQQPQQQEPLAPADCSCWRRRSLQQQDAGVLPPDAAGLLLPSQEARHGRCSDFRGAAAGVGGAEPAAAAAAARPRAAPAAPHQRGGCTLCCAAGCSCHGGAAIVAAAASSCACCSNSRPAGGQAGGDESLRWSRRRPVPYKELTCALPERSLLLLSKRNPLRRAAVLLTTSSYFDALVLTMIALNCISLALSSHAPAFEGSTRAAVLEAADAAFLAFFSAELLLKVAAQGLVAAPGTYLRDGWNVLDAVTVALGYLDRLGGGNVTALRAVRVLRPLRTISRVRGLRVPVVTLLKALPMLSNVAVLCLFAFFLFGVVAVQLFAGVLRNRCAAPDFSGAVLVNSSSGSSLVFANVSYQPPPDADQMCSGFMAADITWAPAGTSSSVSSSSSSSSSSISSNVSSSSSSIHHSAVWSGGSRGGGWACPAADGLFCAPYINMNRGMTSFDNVLWAWLTIFTCITTEGWSDVMAAVQDALSPWALLYFCALIVFGAFFLINLALAVLFLQFSREFALAPSLAASAAVTRSSSRAGGGAGAGGSGLDGAEQHQHGDGKRGGCAAAAAGEAAAAAGLATRRPQGLLELPGQQAAGSLGGACGSSGDGGQEAGSSDMRKWQGDVVATITLAAPPGAAACAAGLPGCVVADGQPEWSGSTCQQPPAPPKSQQQQQQPTAATAACSQPWAPAWRHCVAACAALRRCCLCISQSGPFALVNLLVIVANTAVMASASYPADPAWASFCEGANVAFAAYFTAELLLKLGGLGLARYFGDRLNQFDALVVVASLAEVAVAALPGGHASTSSLSVLRTFRLLRVFKLARSWRSLNRVISSILHSFSQVVWLSLLLLLFVFVVGLMGMQLFGFRLSSCSVHGARQLCPPGLAPAQCPAYPDCFVPCSAAQAATWIAVPGSPYNGLAYCEAFPRTSGAASAFSADASASAVSTQELQQHWAQVGKASVPGSRFDNIGWAMLTVFQLVTTEGWTDVMYNAMATTHPAAALWFILVILLGSYILLNLFLAVLLESFGSISGGAAGAAGGASASDGTLAAAASAGLLLDWVRQALASSWVGKLVAQHNRVAVLPEEGKGKDGAASASAAPAGPVQQQQQQQQWPTARSTAGEAVQSSSKSFSAQAPDGWVAPGRGSSCLPPLHVNGNAGPLRRFAPLVVPHQQTIHALRSGSWAGASRRGSITARTSSITGTSPAIAAFAASHAGGAAAPPAAGGLRRCSWAGADADAAGWQQLRSEASQQHHQEQQQHQQQHQPALQGVSCCLLGPRNWLRRQLAQLVASRHFETAVLLLVCASSISLALETPGIDPASRYKLALQVLDHAFVVLFALEAAAKVLVQGFVANGRGSYLRSPWNALDFCIVIIGVAMMAASLAGSDVHSLASLRALRTLRALRPLRLASNLPGMRLVINSLIGSLRPLGSVLLVCGLFYVIMGIMGVNLLAGMLYACRNPDGALYDAEYVLPAGQAITRRWCEDPALTVHTSAYHAAINVSMPPYTPQRRWVNAVTNFDNMANAALQLFQISTTELWVEVMHEAIAAVGIDQQPVPQHSPARALFFVAFMIVGGFFTLQLFVSVVIEKFAETHQQQGRSVLLTLAQEEWLKIQRMMADTTLKVQHVPPGGSAWRAAAFRILMSERCELAVMATIGANVIVLALTHADMTPAWQAFMSVSNAAFTAVFTVEAAAKLTVLGPRSYLLDAWCRFDLLVVAVSLAGLAVDIATPHDLAFLPLLRVLRVLRIFRLVPKARGLAALLQTLAASLPALGNVGSVMALFFFIYSVIGMNLFGLVKHGRFLNRHAHFGNLGAALLVLFRMITGEAWGGLMRDCMVRQDCIELLQDVVLPAAAPGSDHASNSNSTLLPAGTWLSPGDELLRVLPAGAATNRCGPGTLVTAAFYCSFVLLCGLVLINLVIGVIIDNMQSTSEDAELPITKSHIRAFTKAWSELDPDASAFIPAVELSSLLRELPPPLGVRGEDNAQAKLLFAVMAVDIPLRHNKVHFLETLHALAGRVAGTQVPADEEAKVHALMHARLPSRDPADAPKYGVAHFYAALHVQAAVKGLLRRHALSGSGGTAGAGRAGAAAVPACPAAPVLQQAEAKAALG